MRVLNKPPDAVPDQLAIGWPITGKPEVNCRYQAISRC